MELPKKLDLIFSFLPYVSGRQLGKLSFSRDSNFAIRGSSNNRHWLYLAVKGSSYFARPGRLEDPRYRNVSIYLIGTPSCYYRPEKQVFIADSDQVFPVNDFVLNTIKSLFNIQ